MFTFPLFFPAKTEAASALILKSVTNGGREKDREDFPIPTPAFPDECEQNIRRAGREKENHRVTKKGKKQGYYY